MAQMPASFVPDAPASGMPSSFVPDTPDFGYGPRWSEATHSYSGAPKGLGFLGPLVRPDSQPNQPTIESEYSRDGTINGKAVQYPLVVPTLTRDELQTLLTAKEGSAIPASIEQKAADYARTRMAAGKSPFAAPGEQQNLYPDVPRVWPKNVRQPDVSSLPKYEQTDKSPNDLPTVVKALWDGINPVKLGQMLPWPKAAGGSGMDNPLFPNNIVANLAALKGKATDELSKGNYLGGLSHYIESYLPLIGPMMASIGDESQRGEYAKATGESIAAIVNAVGPKLLSDAVAARYPLASHPAATAPARSANPAVQFGLDRGVPLDAATVSDNLAVKGAQALADRSLGGSIVATPANAARTAGMSRVAGELASDVQDAPVTPEQAGLSVAKALQDKIAGHTQMANLAYDTIRRLENSESATETVPERSTPIQTSPIIDAQGRPIQTGGEPTTQPMQMPVDVREAKQALQPVYDQMRRQMPITQQQANPGLKAIQNIIEGPDYGPLSQVDRDLSAIKAVAREQGGMAKLAVKALDTAVQKTAADAGPGVQAALEEGRAQTVAKYATSDVLDTLHDEPVRTIKALTAPKDSAIQSLRAVLTQVPEQAPVIARAYLDDLMEQPQKVASWNKFGDQTKAALFPDGSAANLDRFFELTDRISKTNVNPSGSGYMAALGAQGAMLWYDPLHAVPLQITGAVLSKLARSQAAMRALTRGMTMPAASPVAMRTAMTATLLGAAKEAGVPLTFPRAADAGTTP